MKSASEALGKILDIFGDFFKRGIAPSSVLLVLLLATSPVTGVHDDLRIWFTDLSGTAGALALLLFVGTGYIMSGLNQFLIDDGLKGNFNSWLLFRGKDENQRLKDLRRRVWSRMRTANTRFGHFGGDIEFSDYLLYEILGGIDPTSTRAFVDRAKAIGIASISCIFATLYLLYQVKKWWCVPCSILATAVFWFLGWESVKGHYRARAIRLYVNFLMMPDSRLERLLQSGGKEKEPTEDKGQTKEKEA